MSEEQKVAMTSENIENENLTKLREVFPQFVKDGEIDFDALKTFFDTENIVAGTEKYGLNWAGKSNAFQAIRTPATGTLTPQPEESKNFEATGNVFIEGDNLEVLKLLQKHYREKIKMIYIDPPYNTGKDFVYKDNFTQSVADYYEQTGQTQGGIKMTANTEKNGRYHSDWLTMMYPRLFLAKNLLREDGVIFISIDDNEVANLRLIMDEIFGEENFICQLIWNTKEASKGVPPIKMVTDVHEYLLVYQRVGFRFNGILRTTDDFSNPDNDPRGLWRKEAVVSTVSRKTFEIVDPKTGNVFNRTWAFSPGSMKKMIEDGRILFPKTSTGTPLQKKFFNDYTNESVPINTQIGTFQSRKATSDLLRMFDNKKIFDFPKPIELLKFLISQATDSHSLVFDFFAGSAATAHAVMDLNAEDDGNRKWICVQLPEVTDEESEAYKAGYKTIAEISRERIRRAGEKIGKGDIGFKSYKLSSSNYRQWDEITSEDDKEKLLQQSKLFADKPLADGYNEQSVVYEIMVKEGFDLNAKVIQEKSDLKPWVITDGDKKLVASFVDKITKDQVESLKLSASDIFVCFDSTLDDTTKVNISRNINLKVI